MLNTCRTPGKSSGACSERRRQLSRQCRENWDTAAWPTSCCCFHGHSTRGSFVVGASGQTILLFGNVRSRTLVHPRTSLADRFWSLPAFHVGPSRSGKKSACLTANMPTTSIQFNEAAIVQSRKVAHFFESAPKNDLASMKPWFVVMEFVIALPFTHTGRTPFS